MNFLEFIKKDLKENIPDDYRPAGWLNSSFSLSETVLLAEKIKKKKKDLTDEEKVIIYNYNILKSCYRTTKHLLKLAKLFIGKFNFDPYFNTYGFTNDQEFAEKDFRFLSGYSDEDDGFSLPNWHRITYDLEEVIGWSNPPFNRLEDAAKLLNEFSKEKEVRFAFLHTLDYTNYLQECLKQADYLILLGRVKFIPMPGIKVSSAKGSVGLSIYNSKLNIKESQFIKFENKIYYCINLKKERQIRDLSQLSLDFEDILISLSPEELELVPSKEKEISKAIEKMKLVGEMMHQQQIQNGVVLK